MINYFCNNLLKSIYNNNFDFLQKPKTFLKSEIEQEGKKLHFPNAWQIPVLNQNDDGTWRRGYENCGYHALKNGLALIQFFDTHNSQFFTQVKDREFFLNLYHLWEPQVPNMGNDKDVSISMMIKFLEDIKKSSPFDLNIFPFKQSIEQHQATQKDIPILSAANGLLIGDQLQFGTGEEALKVAVNLWKIAKHPEQDLKHVFIIGLSDYGDLNHWITVGLHQENGEKKWFLMDSFENQSCHARNVIHGLIEHMNHADEYVKEIYQNFVESIIEKRVNWLDPATGDVNLKYAEDKICFLNDMPMRELAVNAFNFMKECGWLENREKHLKQIQELKLIVQFYDSHLNPKDPIFTEILQKIS